jgi:fermentation-respiration switch protein FrsA (DUF1100 family)
LRLLLVLTIVAYLALVALALFSDRVIFQPRASSYRLSAPEISRAGIQPLTFASGETRIAAFYVPNPEARYTLLFSHGNAEDIGDNVPFFRELRQAGFAVFAWDYRGYGESGGVSSERSFYQDAEAAYGYLTSTLQVPPERIITFGRSLGAAAAIDLAARHPVGGLIAEAPFITAFRVMTRVRLLPWDKFDNASRIGRVRCPVLVIHGRSDGVVPWRHGERIYQLANQPKRFLWVEGAGHNDLLLIAGKTYFKALQDFSAWLEAGSQVQSSLP